MGCLAMHVLSFNIYVPRYIKTALQRYFHVSPSEHESINTARGIVMVQNRFKHEHDIIYNIHNTEHIPVH